MAPPVVAIVADEPEGEVIVRFTLPEAAELTVIAEAPEAVILGAVVVSWKVRLGAYILMAPPPEIVWAVASATVSVFALPTLNVVVPVGAMVPVPAKVILPVL
jgi:hypothetical protein